MKRFDIFVIGTGVSGTAIANSCASKGLKTGIVDQREYGGTCAMRGCIPKKVLWGATQVVESAARLQGKGIDTAPTINWKALMAFKQTFIESTPATKEKNFNENGITTLHGTAKFISANQLQIRDETIEAEKIVIATGNKTRKLEIPGKEHALTSEDFLNLEKLPSSMLFIGGGYIALEFAHIAARCGAKVTIVERGDTILSNFEEDMVYHLAEISKEMGIEIVTQTEVTAIKPKGSEFEVHGKKDGKPVFYSTRSVVNAAGRVPEIDGLDLQKGKVDFSSKGIEVNEFLQSVSNPRVYAAGDAAASPGLPLTPLASVEADVVIENLINGNHQKPDYSEMPTVVFTIPVLASVGLTEKQAKEKKLDFRVNLQSATTWFSAKRINARKYAFKTLIEKDTEKILGAHLIGPHAEETINLFAMAIKTGITTGALKKLIYSYPSSATDVQSMV
ncbi:MAG: dihydrolipoyl dehydrogenase family protein [Bacteroidales bacterium]